MSLVKKFAKWIFMIILLYAITIMLFGAALSPTKIIVLFLKTFSAA